MKETNRNCVKVERWQMSVLEKGLENSLNGPVDWRLSIVSLLSGAFELTAFEHSRCRPSRKLNYFLPSFCFRGISASGAPNLRLRFHQSFQFCARFAHYSNPFLPSSSTACTFRSNLFRYLTKLNVQYLQSLVSFKTTRESFSFS